MLEQIINTCYSSLKKEKYSGCECYEIPEGGKTSKGRAIQNLVNIEPDDKVKAFIGDSRFKR